VINSEIWYEVVHWVTWLFIMFVLSASCARANWIGLHIKHNILNIPVSVNGFLFFQVGKRRLHINVKRVCLVLNNIWFLLEFEIPLVSGFSRSPFFTSLGFLDVVINSEVWNEVVHWVSWWSSLLFVLIATGARADWVRIQLNVGGSWWSL